MTASMAARWMVARVEMRRRWSAFIVLALLVGVSGAVVLTALVGAHRTSTTVARFRSWADGSDVTYQTADPAQGPLMLAAARDLPQVDGAAGHRLVNAFPVDLDIPDLAVLSDPEGAYGTTLDRPLILDGRFPDEHQPDEILLNELAARVTGLEVGDSVRVRTWTEDDLRALFEETNFPGFNGPELELRVVGVGRTLDELTGDVRRTAPYALGSPALLNAHPDLGAWPPAISVRLRHPSDLGAVEREMATFQVADVPPSEDLHYNAGTTASEVYLDTAEQTVNSLAIGLLLLALGAAVAGSVAVGQAVSRQLAGSASSVQVLRSLGLTRSDTAMALSLPVVGAGIVGAVIACALAVVASPFLPLGLARRAEVDPGVWIDAAILAAGSAVIVGALAAWSFRAARRSQMATTRAARSTPTLVRAAASAGASPTVAVGMRLASDRGGRSLAVRSAFVGLAIGVAGVLAAGVIAVSYVSLTDDPARWGWSWSTQPDYFGDDDVVDVQRRLQADERVAAVGNYTTSQVALEGESLTAHAMTALKGDLSFTMLDGRLPAGPREIVLGRQSMEDLDVSIGDTVEAVRSDGTKQDLAVVGAVVLPPTEEVVSDVGAVLTPDGLQDVRRDEPLSTFVLLYPDDADGPALEAALAADYGLQFNLFTQPQIPGSIRNISEGRDIGWALAVFFAVLGAVGLLHALLVSTRQRRSDFAVLRALGLRRRQVRSAVLVEALVLCIGGAVVGIPAGLIAGRFVWRVLVGNLGIADDPQTPWVLVLVALPIAALIGAALTWWPSRAAVRGQPAAGLRVE